MGEFDSDERRRREREVVDFLELLRQEGVTLSSQVAAEGDASALDLAAVDEALELHRWAVWPALPPGE
ncbi:hypothetical protein [Salsipaludibacter albus]|uniref:hypothetical protein n=1 Tax=Salsipaludibacter albus TaxID=2849650 RepID=UPI001EE4B00C|nr:hypothetical protein [Salsipaludibacter albus]MBY5163280.1 hypothetical protein [Salsipaludibacter albus]